MPVAVVAAAGSGPSPSGASRGAPAVILSRDEDLRTLLRGVLLLEGHRIALEASGPEALARLGPAQDRTLLLLAAEKGDGSWREDLATALKARPELRAIVLLPNGSEPLQEEAELLGARVALVRPIALQAMMRAVREALEAP